MDQTEVDVEADVEVLYQRFCKELLEWIEKGCQEHPIFYSGVGLCHNLKEWLIVSLHNPDWRPEATEVVAVTISYQASLFKAAGYPSMYPFDTKESYRSASYGRTLYANPERLKWILKHSQS